MHSTIHARRPLTEPDETTHRRTGYTAYPSTVFAPGGRRSMRTRVILVIGAFSALLGCGSNSPTYGGGGGGNGCTPTGTQVCMMSLAFSPSNLTISHGTTVTWRNGDAVNHQVASAIGSTDTYNSSFIAGGGTFSHTFATAGTYQYYCTIHGVDGTPPTGMHGTITVN